MSTVLDASALLALLQREAGAERVADALPDATMCIANLAEVAAKQADLGLDPSLLVTRVEALGVRIQPVTAHDVVTQAELHRSDREHRVGLSLGDRLCVALGLRLGLPVLTADRRWSQLDLPIEVVLLR